MRQGCDSVRLRAGVASEEKQSRYFWSTASPRWRLCEETEDRSFNNNLVYNLFENISWS